MGILLSERVENIVGKGEMARYEQLLLFKSRLFLMRHEYLWSKGFALYQMPIF